MLPPNIDGADLQLGGAPQIQPIKRLEAVAHHFRAKAGHERVPFEFEDYMGNDSPVTSPTIMV